VIDATRPKDEVAAAIWAACAEKWPHLASEEKQWA
jgi:hypothetical protein